MTVTPRLFTLSLFVALTAVGACGISGPLEKAAPIWGPDRVAYEAEKAKQDAEAKQKAAEREAREAARKNGAPAPKN